MLDEKTLKSSLNSGSLLPVYIVAGDDNYLKSQAVKHIISAAVGQEDEFNTIRFGFDADMQDVYDELNGFPFMSDKKCVILKDFDFNDKKNPSNFDSLLEMAGELYETSVFIIYFSGLEVDFKSAKFKGLVSAAEKAGGALVKIDHKGPSEIAAWICKSATKNGCEISRQNAAYLIEICSQEISILSNEVTKLCAYVGSGEITKEIIDKVSVKTVEASVYDIAKNIMLGNCAGAMKILDELFFMNIDGMAIYYNISSSFVDMYRAYSAAKAGVSLADAAGAFKMGNRAFVLERAGRDLQKFGREKLELSLSALLNAERQLKSYSQDERTVLEKLIVNLIYIMKTGESLD